MTAVFWIALAATLAQRPGEDVIDRVAAVVGSQVITQSEVDLAAQIQLVRLGRHGQLEMARAPQIRNRALEYLTAQAVIYEEARRLAFQRIRKEEVENQLKDFRSKFPSLVAYRKFLSDNELSESDLAEIFRRALLTSRFAEDSVRLNVQVREREIDEYLAKNGDSEIFAGKKPEEVRELARRLLFRQRFDKALREWIAELRKRTRIRVLVTYR
jgi:hypothetical protein